MQLPHSKLYQKNNQRLIPSMRKKAVIVNFNRIGTSVSMYFLDNPQTIIKNVPASVDVQNYLEASAYINNSNSIAINCVVDIFDESNLSQMIIAYVY